MLELWIFAPYHVKSDRQCGRLKIENFIRTERRQRLPTGFARRHEVIRNWTEAFCHVLPESGLPLFKFHPIIVIDFGG
ncbi:hypothetical protein CHR56_00945 [Rhizobium leguminosarum bv. viciae]|nr:hypothetical protein CHR56_00945 [Rhizobium leguminosarum bv. viciae]